VLKKWAMPYDALLCGSGDKNPRFDSVKSGAAFGLATPVEVVAYLGDNIRDFPQAGQELRKKDDAAFAEFGGRFFAFPNPLYGSWLSNPD
jgi:predicted secreted acid phosphatase